MLDVHAPDHKLHGFRDFVVHILTITVGLLIALGLEAGVEALHHRHQRREAETMVREELQKNNDLLRRNAAGLKEEQKGLVEFIAVLRDTLDDKKPALDHVKLSFHEEEIPDAAWRTASSTGVLELLPYEEVARFADAYREQALLQSMAQKTLEDYLELTPSLASDGEKTHPISRADAERLLPLALRTLGHLNGIQATGEGALASYRDALK